MYDDVVVDDVHPEWAAWMVRRWSADDVPVRRVLDVGCGTGTLAAALVSHGCDVAGVDASEDMLRLARARLPQAVALVPASLPHLPAVPGAPFDAVVSTFDVLNNLDASGFAASVAALHGLLRPGGWFVADLHTTAVLDLVEQEPVARGSTGRWSHVLEHDVDRRAGTVRSRITVDGGGPGDAFAEEHVQWVHGDEVVRAALAAAGFTDVEVVAEYGDGPVTADTLRATWVARA